MSFPKRRLARKEKDRAYAQAARVQHHDPEAKRYTGGNVYSSADLEALEREHTKFWRRKRRR